MITGEAAVVCFPTSTAEVAAAVRVCRDHGRPFVPRGSGTGLAGGATPAGEVPPVVIVTTKMNRILEVDPDQRLAWVQPGVLNLDLSRAVARLGLHFAPDPSSQQSCSDRRQPGQQLRRSALPPLRRHQRPHPGGGGGPPRR